MGLWKIFWENNILIEAEDVGGNTNRTVSLKLASGKVWVKTSGDGVREI